MPLTLVTASTELPVSIAEARAQCRIDHSDEDVQLDGWIRAATEHCQNVTWRQFVTATLALRMCDLPSCIYVPRPPLIAVSSITYTDLDGDTQTVSSSLYVVDSYSQPGRIIPAYNAVYPSDLRGYENDVTVTYTAGYGTAASVPTPLKQAILLLVSHYRNQREAAAPLANTPIDFSVRALLAPYAIRSHEVLEHVA